MALSCGFYNSLNHDRKYDARDFGQLFDGIIRNGIFMSIGTCFMVTASEGMVVLVGSGHAWFNQTWTHNDAPIAIEMPQSEVILNRIDTIVLEVNTSVDVRDNTIKVIKGTPSSEPVRPELVNTEEVHQYPLCDISISADSTEITQSNITNRVGTEDTPFVTGVLDTISIDSLIAQWEDEWDIYINRKIEETVAWTEEEKKLLEDYRKEIERENDIWQNATKLTFEDWFNNLQIQLEGDVAANLQLQMDTLNRITFERFNSIMNITTDINRDSEGKLLNIVEDTDESNSVTTFVDNDDGSKTITTELVPKIGHWNYTKTVHITDADTGKHIEETFTRLGKPEVGG